MNRLFRYGLLMIVVWGVLSPGIAHAYVDPGTAGFVITTWAYWPRSPTPPAPFFIACSV